MDLIKNLLIIIALIGIKSVVCAQNLSSPIISDQAVFMEENGTIAIEAEHFYKQSVNKLRQWYIISKNTPDTNLMDQDEAHLEGASNHMYLEILPDTRVTHADSLIVGVNFSNEAGIMGLLHYKVKINNPGRYYVWVSAFSTGGEDNGIHVGIDGEWPESGQRMQWCEGKNSWKWESKQRTEAVHCGEPFLIYLDIKEAGIHEIQFSMREDGFEFDQFLLTTDKEYIPSNVDSE